MPNTRFEARRTWPARTAELHPESQVHGGKIGDGRHQHHQGLEPVIGQTADIFQPVTLLDEPDDVLDALPKSSGGEEVPFPRVHGSATV